MGSRQPCRQKRVRMPYLKTESIAGVSTVSNGQVGIQGGSLNIAVERVILQSQGCSPIFFQRQGGGILTVLSVQPRASDGSFYVGNYAWGGGWRIEKFDSKGDPVMALVGSMGAGDGQFYEPSGIAVGPDSSVYVGRDRKSPDSEV